MSGWSARTELVSGNAYQAVNRLLSMEAPPTAVVCLDDPVGIECQQAVLRIVVCVYLGRRGYCWCRQYP